MVKKKGTPDNIGNPSYCLFGQKCLSDNAREKLKNQTQISDSDYKIKIEKAFNTNDEMDKSKLDLIVDDRTLDILGTENYLEELLMFKPFGPQGNKLYSNFPLNTYIKQMNLVEPTFFGFKSTIFDFADESISFNMGNSDDPNDLFKSDFNNQYLTYGCVLNTLTSEDAKRGIVGHWVGLFIDLRKNDQDFNTIEYFNSSGRSAPKKVNDWMEKLARYIQEKTGEETKVIMVSNVQQQKGPSECGIYAWHFIMCRLFGIPYKEFRKDKISDEEIQKMRKIFFNKEEILQPKIKKLLKSRMMI